MSLACLVEELTPMAKAKRDDRVAKIDRSVIDKAEFVALDRGQTLAEYLSEALRPVVDRDYEAYAESVAKRLKASPPKPPKR